MIGRGGDYIFIGATVLLTVYGQLALKWRMDRELSLPAEFGPALQRLLLLLLDPIVASSFIAAFVASLTWMAAMTRFQLSYAYPFTSLSFVLVLMISTTALGETFSWGKALGVALIVAGVVVTFLQFPREG